PSWTRKPAPQVGAGFLIPPSQLTTHRNPLESPHPTWGHHPLNIITLIRVILILPTQLPGVGPIRVQLLRILTLKRGLHQKLTPPRSEDVVLLIPTQLIFVQLEVLPHPVTVHGDGVTDFPTQLHPLSRHRPLVDVHVHPEPVPGPHINVLLGVDGPLRSDVAVLPPA